jgi:hypothetical protein
VIRFAVDISQFVRYISLMWNSNPIFVLKIFFWYTRVGRKGCTTDSEERRLKTMVHIFSYHVQYRKLCAKLEISFSWCKKFRLLDKSFVMIMCKPLNGNLHFWTTM